MLQPGSSALASGLLEAATGAALETLKESLKVKVKLPALLRGIRTGRGR